MANTAHFIGRPALTLRHKLGQMSWGLVALLMMVAFVGFAMLYSAANGSLEPWASRQMVRFGVGMVLMFIVAMIDIRQLHRFAYAFFVFALLLLVAVEVMGRVGMGAQRWIDLGVFQLQPSELMKLALVLALARYFHGLGPEGIAKMKALIGPIILIGVPTALVLKQPDLGTAMLLAAGGVALCFAAGIQWRYFIGAAVACGAALPVAWQMLHDYQRQRILTYLDPSTDPLGAGYHILQSKIALGSGGMFGKGFMAGTQSHLEFLPEMQTDFIFTMLAEELGMAGALLLLLLYVLIIAYGIGVSLRATSQFGRLVALGVTVTFFLYVFINIAMVTGLVPVVGVPLPLISYGGTAMMTLMVGFGMLASVHVHRDTPVPRRPGGSLY
ncbi:MAG: rod shape-determining protein RodA [Pseudomonadota bacterium]